MKVASGALISIFITCAILIQGQVSHGQLSPGEIEDQHYNLKRHQLECIEETRVDPDKVMKVKKGQFQAKADQLLKMWTLCTLMKQGLMTPQGVYKYDTALSRVPAGEVENVGRLIDRCLSKKALPPADIAYNFVRCYDKVKGNNTLVSIVV